jgi:hypothetical protein
MVRLSGSEEQVAVVGPMPPELLPPHPRMTAAHAAAAAAAITRVQVTRRS